MCHAKYEINTCTADRVVSFSFMPDICFCLVCDALHEQVENMLSRASRGGQFETLVYHSAIDPKQVKTSFSVRVQRVWCSARCDGGVRCFF